MLQNYATIPLYITHKNVTFCHEGTGVQKGFLVAACLLACSLFKHPLLSIVKDAVDCLEDKGKISQLGYDRIQFS